MLSKIKNNFNTLGKVDRFLYISSSLIQLCVGLVLLYALYKIYINTPSNDINKEAQQSFYIYISIFLFFLLTATVVLFHFNREFRLTFTITFICLLIPIYGFNFYFEFDNRTINEIRKNEAENRGISFDSRKKVEVLRAISENKTIYSNIYPRAYFRDDINTKPLVPLGSIANSLVLEDNEMGYYPIWKLDEHGFNNPQGLYDDLDVDIVIVGDSFGEGCCVQQHESVSFRLNDKGIKTISLAKGANSALTELATITEFAKHIKPKVVLWFFYYNDILDRVGSLDNEYKVNILRNYLLDSNFTQKLIERQDEVDRKLEKFYHEKLQKYLKKTSNYSIEKKEFTLKTVKNILLLRKLRERIGFPPNQKATIKDSSKELFRQVLKAAKNRVEAWGGKLIFVHLPTYRTFSSRSLNVFNEQINEIVLDLSIPLMDFNVEFKAGNRDPLSYFPFGFYGHYNKEGYELISNYIKSEVTPYLRSKK